MSQCDNTNASYVGTSIPVLLCPCPPDSNKSGHFTVFHFLSMCMCACIFVSVPCHLCVSHAMPCIQRSDNNLQRSVLFFHHAISRNQSEDGYVYKEVSPPSTPSCQPKSRHLRVLFYLTEWRSSCVVSLDFQIEIWSKAAMTCLLFDLKAIAVYHS